MLLLLALACAPKTNENIVVTGTLLDQDDENGAPVSGASVRSINLYTEVVDGAQTDGQGAFSLQAPAIDTFFISSAAEGHVPTSVVVQAGTDDVAAPDGSVWIRRSEDHAAAMAPFAGCPGADQPGGVIEGEVRVYLGETVESGDSHPLVTTARAYAEGADGALRAACTLNDEGIYDGASDETGQTGRFAIFGLAEGIAALQISYMIEDTLQVDQVHSVYVRADGVAPMYPAWVPLP